VIPGAQRPRRAGRRRAVEWPSLRAARLDRAFAPYRHAGPGLVYHFARGKRRRSRYSPILLKSPADRRAQSSTLGCARDCLAAWLQPPRTVTGARQIWPATCRRRPPPISARQLSSWRARVARARRALGLLVRCCRPTSSAHASAAPRAGHILDCCNYCPSPSLARC